MSRFLSYGRQSLDDADIEAVTRVLRSDWLTQGPLVEAFEKALTEVTGAAYAVACNSGTAALHLAAVAAGVGPGRDAVVPAVTFLATANVARMAGAEVIFADVDPETGRMTADTLAAAVHGRNSVHAVIPVHLAGAATAMPEIADVAKQHGVIVIEDACHALGGSYERNGKSVPVGACSDSAMGCFSFHPVKPVTTGEGGAITTNDAGLADHMRRLRSHGMTREQDRLQNPSEALDQNGDVNPWYYEMPEIGWNYRLPDILCALGLSQIERLQTFRSKRDALARRYREKLAALAPVVKATPETPGVVSGHHLFAVLIDFARIGRSRSDVMRAMRAKGVGTQVHYVPVPWQPYYKERYGTVAYPGAEAYYRRCLSLPLFVGMTDADVDRVVKVLAEATSAA